MTLSPLERYQQQQQLKQQRKKKSDKTGLTILIGSGVLLLIVIVVVANMRSPDDSGGRGGVRARGDVEVNLSEAQKKALYWDYTGYAIMTGHPENSYKVVADLYEIPEAAARLVVGEGRAKGWPAQKP